MTVDQFEALVLNQAPADKPWAPVTDYSFEGRRAVEGPHAQLIADVFHPELVLDAGCGPGHLVTLLRALGCEVKGIDCANRQWEYGDLTLENCGVSHPNWGLYDLVICREVLEHLTVLQLRKAVRNLCKLSSRFVYVTTRFAQNPTSLLDVDTSDDLDPTHITMLNQDFLRVLFVLEGFKRRKDLEEKLDWQKKGRVLVYERA